MNTYIILMTFILAISYTGLGKHTRDKCYDENWCGNISTDQCYKIENFLGCPKKCGACETLCNDYNAVCRSYADRCDLVSQQMLCPKTCGVCEACEDMINSDFCSPNLLRQCDTNKDVAYVCKKSCGNCWCHDIIDKRNCDILKQNTNYCDNPKLLGCSKTCGYCGK